MSERRVRELIDRADIERLITLYCRAIDRIDIPLLKSVYHPDATDQHGLINGGIDQYADYVQQISAIMCYSMHNVTHSNVEIHGDAAAGESYYLAQHFFRGEREKIEWFFGPTYARRAIDEGTIGGRHMYFCAGRYIDRFERREGEWKIAHRQITNEWNHVAPAADVKPEGVLATLELPGRRDHGDPIYRVLTDVRAFDATRAARS